METHPVCRMVRKSSVRASGSVSWVKVYDRDSDGAQSLRATRWFAPAGCRAPVLFPAPELRWSVLLQVRHTDAMD